MRSALGVILTVVVCLGALLAPRGAGMAQEEQTDAQKTRRVEALSERVHRRLSRAQEAMDADDYAAAELLLLEVMELRNLSAYERAQASRFRGFLYLKREDYPAAIDIFLEIIRMGGPDEIAGLYDESISLLSQLYMQVEDYREAIRFGEMALELKENPPPLDYMRIATAHLQLQQWLEALDYISLAVEKARAAGVPVEENWWRSMVYAHWELEQYAEALEVTRILVTQWPKKDYWLQISGLYSYLEDDPGQLAAYWCAFDQGLLTRSSELVGMAQYFMLAEVPYKAAVVLQEGLDNGSIEKNVRNYRLLAQAWHLAREDRMALEPLRRAAESEQDLENRRDLYVRLAETHNALGHYGECAAVARDALRAGNAENEGRIYMLLGQCLFEQEEFDGAGDAFDRAVRDRGTRRSATQWQTFLRKEIKRRQDLEERLARYAD